VTANLKLPALENLKRVIHDLGGSHALELELREDNAEKAEHLRRTGRDFFSVSGSMKGALLRAAQRAIPQAVATGNVAAAYDAVKEAAREHLVQRFLKQGGDVRLRPLSPDYKRYKQQATILDERIGIALGSLLRNVRTGAMRLRKVR
jgi:hypothetical protein